MSEDLKTIKELADEIGVSKQAVWQKRHPKKSGVTCKIKKVPRKRHLYYNIYFWLFHNHF